MRERVIAQDCENFVETAMNLTVSTKIIHIDGETINNFKDTDPFQNTLPVNGMSKMHVIFVDGHEIADTDILIPSTLAYLPLSQLAKRVNSLDASTDDELNVQGKKG